MKIVWIGSPNYFPGRDGHNPNWTAADPNSWIVLHTTVSTRDNAAARFTSPNGGASATYMVDLDGTIYQYVREEDGPWTDGVNDGVGSNLDSITIEHVDNKDYNGPRTPELYEASAELVADISRRRGIPLIHRQGGGGVIGHRECAAPGGQTACPDGLDVDRIIARANEILHPPPAPPVSGDVPGTVTPPPDTRPEWEKNYTPNPQSFTLYAPVPIISLSDGTGLAGTVTDKTLAVAGDTHAFGQDWWLTAYGKAHGHGMLKSDIAKASTPPPDTGPVPGGETSGAGPVGQDAGPSGPGPGPGPGPPAGHASWADYAANLVDTEIVALIEFFKEHLAKRSGG